MNSEDRLKRLGLVLPELGEPKFSYRPYRRAGDIAYISGQVPKLPDGSYLTGKVGADRSIAEGKDAAKLSALHLLAVAKSITGSLDDIEFLKVFGMVNATADFAGQGVVIEACSQLLIDVLGERGEHARSAVGMGSLPADVQVEIEAVVRVV
ncbi:RidA family protein [Aliihoeflea sp. PC F10.4]